MSEQVQRFEMSEELCECGHPKNRHLYGIQYCTFSNRKAGTGLIQCHCPEFKSAKEES